MLGRVERPLEIVEHRQQLRHEPLRGPRGESVLVAQRALAVVVEVGREPLEIGEVLVPLGLGAANSDSIEAVTGMRQLPHPRSSATSSRRR